VDDFRLILRSDTFSSLQKSLEVLQEAELDIEKHVRQLPHTHTKGMIVDRRHTLIGSHNWSGPGVTINRDASLIFFDNPEVAAYYAEAFDIDWERANRPRVPEMPPIDVRLATTEAPPAGYMRVPLESVREM
jgi:phosphatidylserine/phosphatidylglycerophosphate/cardiolipin synthase-like enzyme